MSLIVHPLYIPDTIRECFSRTNLKGVPFMHVYPDREVTGPIIVWRMVRRWPGKDKKETKRGRIRGVSEADSDKITFYYGQWQTAMFQFDLLHVNDFEADQLMLDFETAVRECQPTLADRGIDNFFFEEQLEDTSLPVSKSITTRSLRYLATMTVYTPVNIARMREIVVNVSYNDQQQYLSVERSSNSYDIVTLNYANFGSINSMEDTQDTDNIVYLGSGVDYTLEDLGNGTLKINWTDYGLHPDPGVTFYIAHSSVSDPVTHVVR